VVTAGAALAAAGCGGTASGSASPATDTSSAAGAQTSSAAPPTAKFDPCAILPADGLAKLGITGPAKIDPDTGNCEWIGGNYEVTTRLNSYPLGKRPPNGGDPAVTPLTIGSRQAELWRSEKIGVCGVDLALGSSSSINLDVVAPDSKGMETACTSAKELATAAEPKLPTT
jgi:hypothetical protein